MRLAICLVAGLSALTACAAPLAPNLLPDPGFEGKVWSLTTWEICEYKAEYVPEAHSGQLAAKLSALTIGKDKRTSAIAIPKPVALEPGRAYLLGLWYRTEPKVNAAVSVVSFSAPFSTATWKTPHASYNTYTLPPSETWRLWTKRFRAPLNAVEGFIRQILGWREFVRGIYWLEGPDYVRRNELGADQPLPWFYWTGETDMACLRQVIGQTRREAYAHHIQRLMVTGNFALILGVDPHAVHEWYLGVYADAFEWVEAPNTIGMSQFADGGRLGSKPYASSGAYINRMSDYCGGCRFDVKARVGPNACPFNYLYWDFLARRRERFARNPRMTQMYATYDRFDDAMRDAIRAEAEGLRRRLADAGG